MDNSLHATTIYAVRHNGEAAMAGDGQVTLGQQVIMKQTARKVRRLYEVLLTPSHFSKNLRQSFSNLVVI